jgi:hypothetical protein
LTSGQKCKKTKPDPFCSLQKGRLTLPSDFAGCLVTIERVGDELRLRKAQPGVGRRYSFRQLMAGVTAENVHTEVQTGPAVGKEVL